MKCVSLEVHSILDTKLQLKVLLQFIEETKEFWKEWKIQKEFLKVWNVLEEKYFVEIFFVSWDFSSFFSKNIFSWKIFSFFFLNKHFPKKQGVWSKIRERKNFRKNVVIINGFICQLDHIEPIKNLKDQNKPFYKLLNQNTSIE